MEGIAKIAEDQAEMARTHQAVAAGREAKRQGIAAILAPRDGEAARRQQRLTTADDGDGLSEETAHGRRTRPMDSAGPRGRGERTDRAAEDV